MMHRPTLCVRALGALLAVPLTACAVASASGQDGDVEWSGISHVERADLRPLVPLGGEAFDVLFQAHAGDLTSARVWYDAGSGFAPVEASVVRTLGPYDIWQAHVPSSSANGTVSYRIELIDGADSDFYGVGGMREDAAQATPFVVNFATLEHAPAGATPVPTGTVFKVWAPGATTGHVRGSFNNWSTQHPLTRQGDDLVRFVPGAQAGQEYKFYFGGLWKPDARAKELRPQSNYNSRIVDPLAFDWQADSFSPRPLDELVVYQIHVGSFAGRNDPFGGAPSPSRYIDVASRASHLAELGVNAVYLNPINEFPGDFSGGYNPITAWAVESAFGSMDDFKTMVDALHQEGIAVWVDIVWNHFAVNENFLWDYTGQQVYFDSPAIDTPWGAQADLDDPRVREYFLEAAEMLFGECRIDGMRVDAVFEMTSANQPIGGQALMRGLNDLVDNRYADCAIIAEAYGDDPWFTRPTSQGGIGFDAQYHQGLRDAVRSAAFDAAFGDPSMSFLASTIVGSGQVQGSRAFNFFELHDDAWPLNGHERAVRAMDTTFPHDDQFATGRTKVANGIVMLARGVPAILQGTEWLEDEGWEANKLDWSHKTTYAGVFDYYRDLIALRTSERALYANSPANVFHVNEGANVIAFERWDPAAPTNQPGSSFVVVANTSDASFAQYTIGLPRAGRWGVAINGDSLAYRGSGAGPSGFIESEPGTRDGYPQRTTIELPARSVVVLRYDPAAAPACACDVNDDGSLNDQDFFDFVNAFFDGGADYNDDGSANDQDFFDFTNCFFGPTEGC